MGLLRFFWIEDAACVGSGGCNSMSAQTLSEAFHALQDLLVIEPMVWGRTSWWPSLVGEVMALTAVGLEPDWQMGPATSHCFDHCVQNMVIEEGAESDLRV